MKGIKRKLKKVSREVDIVISNYAKSGSAFYGGALAGEGYNGGYRDAIQDVMLALNGVLPNRNEWWS